MSGCCGHPGHPSTTRPRRAPAMPANPKISGGVRCLFVGSGRLELTGSASGHMYYLSDHRRAFFAHADDVADLLRHADIIRGR